MSLLWKARVFRDEAHRASFDDDSFDLTPALIAEVFLQDLARRGARQQAPSNPLAGEWQAFLAETYQPPFKAKTTDYRPAR